MGLTKPWGLEELGWAVGSVPSLRLDGLAIELANLSCFGKHRLDGLTQALPFCQPRRFDPTPTGLLSLGPVRVSLDQLMNPMGETWNETTNEIRAAATMQNREFLEMFARPGRVGLAGDASLLAGGRRQTARHLPTPTRANLWTHAFLFEGRRVDGQHWVIECDFSRDRGEVALIVQESRMSRYFDEGLYPSLAVLDFRISDDHVALLVREGLELVARRIRYSLRQLLGTVAPQRRPQGPERGGSLAGERSRFCSAFLKHLFAQAGVDFAPALDRNAEALNDITRIPLPHMTYLLRRPASAPGPMTARVQSPQRKAGARLKNRVAKGSGHP